MSRQGVRPPALKHALPEIVDAFDQRVEADGILLSTTTLVPREHGILERTVPFARFGTFGLLSRNAGIQFVAAAHDVLGADMPSALKDKVQAARRGIRATTMYTEVASLHLLATQPELSESGDAVAAGVTRGYDFIEDSIVASGARIGAEVVVNYLEGLPRGLETSDGADYGAVARGRLTEAGVFRMARFDSVRTAAGIKVVPLGLAAMLPKLRQQYTSPQERLVNCPGHIYRRPDATHNHNREIFDILLKYVTQHVYPDYLPQAAEVVRQEWLELPPSDATPA